MTLELFIQPGWGDAADYYHERDQMYSTSELRILVVVKPQRNADAATSAPTHLQSLVSVLILSQEYCKYHKGLLNQEVAIQG